MRHQVFVQTELARFTIASGKTFLEVFNALPGLSVRRPSWLTLEFMATVVVASFLRLAVYTYWDHWRNRSGETVSGVHARAGLIVTAVVIIAATVIARQHQSPKGRRIDGADANRDERPRVGWFMRYWLVSYY